MGLIIIGIILQVIANMIILNKKNYKNSIMPAIIYTFFCPLVSTIVLLLNQPVCPECQRIGEKISNNEYECKYCRISFQENNIIKKL